MSAIVLDGVTRRYRQAFNGNDILALDNLSLEIRQGEIFGFAGLNGAGKTTAIKVMLGITRPDSGTASLLGGCSASDSAYRTGFSPETADLPLFLSVEEVLEYSCVLCGVDATSTKIDRAVALLDLNEFRQRRIEFLSKGMKQRVSLAAAIVHRPELVILDEPSSGLDPAGRKLVKSLIRQLHQEGSTVFFSTHILSDLPGLCHRMGIISRGRLVFCGTPEELRAEDSGNDIEEAFSAKVAVDASVAGVANQ